MEETSAPSGRFAPARFFPAQYDLIKWGPDYAPRFAAVYDVFGNGRTALKTSFSKYHRQYDADPFLVYADAGLRSRAPQLVRRGSRAGHGRHAIGRCEADRQRPHRAGQRNRHRLAARSALAPTARRSISTASTTSSSRRACSIRWRRVSRSASCSTSGQIKNIQLTDRVAHHGTDYTAFNTTIPASEWANIARDPAVAAVLDQNEVITLYNLNKASNADLQLRDGRSQQLGQQVALHRHGGVVLDALPRPARRFSAAGRPRGTSRSSANRTTTRTGRPTDDLYQGRPVAQGGRFCDQRNFDMPFIHEFKLAGNYQLPRWAWTSARCCRATPASSASSRGSRRRTSIPGGQRTQAQTIVLNEPGSLFDRTLGSARHQFQEEHPVRQQGSHLPAGHLQRVQQQLDPHGDRRGRHVARTGDGDHAWAFPEARRISSSGKDTARNVETKNVKRTEHAAIATGGARNRARPVFRHLFAFRYSFFVTGSGTAAPSFRGSDAP